MSALLLQKPGSLSTKAKPVRAYRWTRFELYDLCSAGWFHDRKVMLIDGRIIVMPMPKPPHDAGLNRTYEYLRTAFGSGYFVRNQQALGVSKRNDPGPDLAVVLGSHLDYETEHPTTALFVAEISDSTLRTDTQIKPHLYALAGVPEYWVLDLVNRRLIVHTNPIADREAPRGVRYARVISYDEAATVAPQALPDAATTVTALLPRIS